MSQAGDVDIVGGHPDVPTDFIADVGNAVPIANTLELLGEVVAAGTNPFRSIGSGNTITYQVQIAQAIAATDATKIGLASFDSACFNVDPNGFVTLAGGGSAIDSIGTQTGTNPIVPDGTGLVTINGAVVAAGTNPVRSDGTGPNTIAIEVQISQAIAATDATKIGLCNFDSAAFNVDANGFVTLLGGGQAIDSFSPDSGTDPVVPTVNGLVNMKGSGSVTTVGSLNTVTFQLTGLTNHAVLVGAGTTTITKVGPTATIGQVLQSAGAAADPAFSTATYPLTTTINEILYSSAANTVTGLATVNRASLSTNSTGVPTWLAMTDGQVIIGSTAGSPAAATLTAGAGISILNASNGITIAATAGGFTWNNTTGTSATLVAQNGYFANNAGLVTFALPSTVSSTMGDTIRIVGLGAGGWAISQAASQQIIVGSASSTSGAGGSVASTNRYDTIELIYSPTSGLWRSTFTGNLTVT